MFSILPFTKQCKAFRKDFHAAVQRTLPVDEGMALFSNPNWALDEGHLVADAARAAALLALRTRDAADRSDAQRRLRALGDRAYLQRLAEDW
jgi:hypothetical protein